MTFFLAFVVLGIGTHLGVALVADNRLTTPWSGGGDTPEYVALAGNLLSGDGYTFAHQATAFRAPLYPLLLTVLMMLSSKHWLITLRALQFLASLATAWLCGRLARRWFGITAGRFAAITALYFPTLLFFTGEVLTECTAALLVIIFLLRFDEALRVPTTRSLGLLGLSAGVVALERFNAAALVLVALFVVFVWTPRRLQGARSEAPSHMPTATRLRRLVIVGAACGIVVGPWLIHTAVAFRGQALYTTHSGFGAVEGVIMPLGRTQTGETDLIKKELGWGNWDVESNSTMRLKLPSEPELNRQAWNVARRLWSEKRWSLAPIGAQKICAFWLSTDQIIYTHSLTWRKRVVRSTGVVLYWMILMLAVFGWFRLRGAHPSIAAALLLYALVLTVMHLPFTMNTRLRSPLVDPLLASLAGGGLVSVTEHFRPRSSPYKGNNLDGDRINAT